MNVIAKILHLTIYRWILFPLLMGVAWILSFYSEKIAHGFRLRKTNNGLFPWQRMKIKDPIWIHVSSGEFEYAKPLVKWVKANYPKEKILVTYFSPSVKPSIDAVKEVDQAIPSPWDHPYFLNGFFKEISPKVLLISRTDFWPEMIYQAKLRGIPRLLFSATFSSESSRILNPLRRVHFRWMISQFSKIYCVDEMDRVNFESLGSGVRCEVLGDTRYDQVMDRIQQPKPINENLKPEAGETVFVAGSTWEPDEDQLIPSLKDILNLKVRVILAPHEPTSTHLSNIEQKLKNKNIKFVRYSNASTWSRDEILIVDKVGILAELYQWGKFAFVGNSFRTNSIHSVMEPLAAGCVTFIGPRHYNNREAIAFKKIKSQFVNTTLAAEIENGRDLVEQMKLILQSPKFAMLQDEIKKNVQKRAGVTKNLGHALEQMSVLN